MRHLNEEFLGDVLQYIFPDNTFIRDKVVPNSNSRRRPDYRCDELNLIVEFDGDRHYKEASKIKSEREKVVLYESMGYKVVRIPYFIQLNTEVVKFLFNKDLPTYYEYPQGFISKLAANPCDYCELGVKKFIEDLNRFDVVKEEVIKSLISKIEELKDIELVLPKSIEQIIN